MRVLENKDTLEKKEETHENLVNNRLSKNGFCIYTLPGFYYL